MAARLVGTKTSKPATGRGRRVGRVSAVAVKSSAAGGREPKTTPTKRRTSSVRWGRPVTPEDVRAGATLAVCRYLMTMALETTHLFMRQQNVAPQNVAPFKMPDLRPNRGALLCPARKHFMYMAARATTPNDAAVMYHVKAADLYAALVELARGAEINPKDLEGVRWPEVD